MIRNWQETREQVTETELDFCFFKVPGKQAGRQAAEKQDFLSPAARALVGKDLAKRAPGGKRRSSCPSLEAICETTVKTS